MAARRSVKKRRPQAKRTTRRKKTTVAPLPGWVWLLSGLSIGLFVAIIIWLYRPAESATENLAEKNLASTPIAAQSAPPVKPAQNEARGVKKTGQKAAPAAPPPAKKPEKKARQPQNAPQEPPRLSYDFYTLLPEMEVPVPDNEPAARNLPPAPVAPGIYTLQVGAYRTLKDADVQKATLAQLGLSSTIQVITIDSNPLYRVRIGPIQDLDTLSEIRSTLQKNNQSFMLLREKE
jgi:cell division protein FtsN